MTKWINFYKTGESKVVVLHLETMFLQDNGQEHMFTDPVDAQSKCTNEVVIFWDNQLIGKGLVESSS